jgi:DNA polymerase
LAKDDKVALGDLREQLGFLDEAGAGFFFVDPAEDRPVVKSESPPDAASPSRISPSGPERVLGEAERKLVREMEGRILECRLCPLHRLRTNAVPGEGNWAAELMFVGEAPGRDEDAQGRPFVGRAGKLLRKIIAAMKFREEEVFITNVVKCRPPDNRTPHRDEVEVCSPYLVKQIELIRPSVIVTLGKSSTEFFIPGRTGMSSLRGKFGDYRGIPLMPTFHPSYLIRNEGNRELRRMVWEDMQQVMALLGKK